MSDAPSSTAHEDSEDEDMVHLAEDEPAAAPPQPNANAAAKAVEVADDDDEEEDEEYEIEDILGHELKNVSLAVFLVARDFCRWISPIGS